MSAFNRRFDVKRIAGIQTPAWIGLIAMLVCGVFALMVPWVLKILCLTIFFVAFYFVFYVFYFGDDYVFRRLIFMTRKERLLRTSIDRLRY